LDGRLFHFRYIECHLHVRKNFKRQGRKEEAAKGAKKKFLRDLSELSLRPWRLILFVKASTLSLG
jgi:hypothetical protein